MAEYIDYINNAPRFPDTEITLFNRLMDESIEVCNRNHAAIYALDMDIVTKELRTTA